MKVFILLVTWAASGQAPMSYQKSFSAAAECHAARDAVLAEARRLREDFDRRQADIARVLGEDPPAFLARHPAPAVTAQCVEH